MNRLGLKKNRKRVLSIVLAVTVLVAGCSVFWFVVMPNVDYWLDPNYRYQQFSDGWVTINHADNSTINGACMSINCKNNGVLPATFDVTIAFSGATFSTDTPQPYEQINGSAAKFTFTLNGFEQKSHNVYFTIANSSRLTASLSLQTNQILFKMMDVHGNTIPWQNVPCLVSYRELTYYNSSGNLVAAVIC
ncbi:MAG: hypothetical protein ACQCN6_13180 [Candidatus Bathyarchaeia archaeon]|jgi:hypothetical protein